MVAENLTISATLTHTLLYISLCQQDIESFFSAIYIINQPLLLKKRPLQRKAGMIAEKF